MARYNITKYKYSKYGITNTSHRRLPMSLEDSLSKTERLESDGSMFFVFVDIASKQLPIFISPVCCFQTD